MGKLSLLATSILVVLLESLGLLGGAESENAVVVTAFSIQIASDLAHRII